MTRPVNVLATCKEINYNQVAIFSYERKQPNNLPTTIIFNFPFPFISSSPECTCNSVPVCVSS